MNKTNLSANLPSGWEMKTVGEVASILRGVTYKKADASPTPAPGLLPLLRATNISDGLSFDDCVFVPAGLVRKEQLLREGDIVMAASSGSRKVVGKSAQLLRPWRGSFGAFCSVVRPEPEVSPRYLGWFLASDSFRKRASHLAAGSNINNLKREHISETPVPLPPREEQDRIAKSVSRLFADLDIGLGELLTARKRSKAHRRAILHLTQNEDWKEARFGEVLDLKYGKGLTKKHRIAGSVPVYSAAGEIDSHNEALANGPSLVLARKGVNIGSAYLSSDDCWVIDTAFFASVPPNCNGRFLLYQLIAANLGALDQSTAIPSLTRADLEKVVLRIPTRAVQDRVVQELDVQLTANKQAADSLGSANAELVALRKAILYCAVTGQLRTGNNGVRE